MPSWIDAKNKEIRRSMGIAGALSQDHHEKINSKYPGLTREHCFLCDSETGRAGRADDSIYDRDDDGPYCEPCYFDNIERFEQD